MKNTLLIAFLALFLSACSSQLSGIKVRDQQTTTTVISKIDKVMFVRGDFTLWDADPVYQMREQEAGLYQTRVKFTTPGKVYEFKIADANWSEGYNCGYAVEGKLALSLAQVADCRTVYNYFSFTPERKGWYIIQLDYRNPRQPLVSVLKG
ncbi:hypothetical protein ACFOEE_11885 [Pseudoalteromonas fenneropenaei]|uniref:Pullulanase n=1 Tax=Pseudoalteromonas fenneropenaei TaxID=1737459 RepID=A0ABV7CKP4_9GAMM